MRFSTATRSAAALAAGLLAAAAAAEEAATQEKWERSLELGYVQTAGNTQVRSLSARARALHEMPEFRWTADGAALNTSDRGTTTSEKYSASWQGDWKLSERDYVFARLSFEADRFGGFRRRTSETAGYGRTLFDEPSFRWKADVGAGFRQTKRTDDASSSELVGRAATNLVWSPNESVKLGEELKTEGGKSGFVTDSLTYLESALGENLSSRASVALHHVSKVPPGTKNLDVEIALSLALSF